jgi:hypothetical protein
MNIQRHDGFGDTAKEDAARVIRGSLIKFSEGVYSSSVDTVPLNGRQLLALAVTAAYVKWQGGKPVSYRIRPPGGTLADRNDLGDLDEDLWEEGLDGKPKDPWQSTRFVHLVDPQSAEAFTFTTSSQGGIGAVVDLCGSIERKRSAVDRAVVPLVALDSGFMPTRWGKKQRPVLRIVRWEDGAAVSEPAPQLPLSPPAALAGPTPPPAPAADEPPPADPGDPGWSEDDLPF